MHLACRTRNTDFVSTLIKTNGTTRKITPTQHMNQHVCFWDGKRQRKKHEWKHLFWFYTDTKWHSPINFQNTYVQNSLLNWVYCVNHSVFSSSLLQWCCCCYFSSSFCSCICIQWKLGVTCLIIHSLGMRLVSFFPLVNETFFMSIIDFVHSYSFLNLSVSGIPFFPIFELPRILCSSIYMEPGWN